MSYDYRALMRTNTQEAFAKAMEERLRSMSDAEKTEWFNGRFIYPDTEWQKHEGLKRKEK